MSLLQSEGAVTGLSVRLDDYDNAEKARKQLRERLAPGAVFHELPSAGEVRAVALSRDGSRAAALNAAGELVIWEADTGREARRLATDLNSPDALALSADGSLAVVGAADGAFGVWDVENGERAFGGAANGDGATAVAFSPDGWVLAIGRHSGTVSLWDPDTSEEIVRMRGHKAAVNAIDFDAMSERLLTASDDGEARIWAADEDARMQLALVNPFRAACTAAAFSPGGQEVVVGDAEGRVVTWNLKSGRPVGQRFAHASAVRALTFWGSPNEFITAAEDQVRVWLLHDMGGQRLAGLRMIVGEESDPIRTVAFGRDGQVCLIVREDGTPRLCYSGPHLAVVTWEEQQKTFLEAIAMERFLEVLIMSLILVVAEFFVFAILSTMVGERRRDIGILKAIGFTRGQICLVFLLIGLAIGVIGGLLGVGAGVLFTENINAIRVGLREVIGFDPFPADVYYFKDIPTHMGVALPVLTAAGAILCSLFFSIWPALRAARLDPVQTLHYE